MTWSAQPEPADDAEREALVAALERALAEEEAAASGQASAWWRSGFDGLGGFDETSAVPLGRAARPDAASSLPPVSD